MILSSNSVGVPVTNLAPVNVTKSTAQVGTSGEAARQDHKHDATTAAPPVNTGPDYLNSEGVATSLARSDHNHHVKLPWLEVVATGNTTTTSLTDVLMDSMTLTPPAGTYLVMFQSSLSDDSNNRDVWVSLYVGGVLDPDTPLLGNFPGNNVFPATIVDQVTVNGTQAIEVRWRVSLGVGTARIRKLLAMRID